MSTIPYSVGDILDCLEELADEGETVSVDQIMNAFGSRTYGPAILVPALLDLTPVGAIPGVPSFLALIVAVVALQKLLGRWHLWLPAFISNRRVSSDKLAKGAEKLRPVARFMDRIFHRRLKFMTRAPFAQIAAAVILLLCFLVPFLEVLPLAAAVPMIAIAAFGVAILVRDGVLMALALGASLAGLGALAHDYYDGGLSDTEEVDGLVDQGDVDAVKETAETAGETVSEAAETADAAANEIGQAAKEAAREAGERADEVVERE